jgi:hypothetical protein
VRPNRRPDRHLPALGLRRPVRRPADPRVGGGEPHIGGTGG